MYRITKPRTLHDTLIFEGDNENLTIEFDLSPSQTLIKDIKQLQLKSIEIDKCIKEKGLTDDLIKSKGECIIALMRLMFGDDNTQKILEFYSDNYIAMLEGILPYMNNTLLPALQQYAKDSKKKAKRKYLKI